MSAGAAGGFLFILVIIFIIGIVWWAWKHDVDQNQAFLDKGCTARTFDQYGHGVIWRCPVGSDG